MRLPPILSIMCPLEYTLNKRTSTNIIINITILILRFPLIMTTMGYLRTETLLCSFLQPRAANNALHKQNCSKFLFIKVIKYWGWTRLNNLIYQPEFIYLKKSPSAWMRKNEAIRLRWFLVEDKPWWSIERSVVFQLSECHRVKDGGWPVRRTGFLRVLD